MRAIGREVVRSFKGEGHIRRMCNIDGEMAFFL